MTEGECIGYLNRALEEPIRIIVESPQAATALRAKINKIRKRSREDSLAIYEMTDERWGRSPWDGLSITLIDATIELRQRKVVVEPIVE